MGKRFIRVSKRGTSVPNRHISHVEWTKRLIIPSMAFKPQLVKDPRFLLKKAERIALQPEGLIISVWFASKSDSRHAVHMYTIQQHICERIFFHGIFKDKQVYLLSNAYILPWPDAIQPIDRLSNRFTSCLIDIQSIDCLTLMCASRTGFSQ